MIFPLAGLSFKAWAHPFLFMEARVLQKMSLSENFGCAGTEVICHTAPSLRAKDG